MTAPVQTTEPAIILAGDTATWRLSLDDYPASDGWVVTYTAVRAGAKISFTSTADGDGHLIRVPPATTAAWSAGAYSWQARVGDGTDAYTVRSGSWEVRSDFAAATESGLDARSHAEKTLAALESWIENHDPAVAEYEIDGRHMKYIAIPDLLTLRDRYRREVRGQSGRSARVYMRF